eukprot:4075574-Ditylum_brightwellii.AAC.1
MIEPMKIDSTKQCECFSDTSQRSHTLNFYSICTMQSIGVGGVDKGRIQEQMCNQALDEALMKEVKLTLQQDKHQSISLDEWEDAYKNNKNINSYSQITGSIVMGWQCKTNSGHAFVVSSMVNNVKFVKPLMVAKKVFLHTNVLNLLKNHQSQWKQGLALNCIHDCI